VRERGLCFGFSLFRHCVHWENLLWVATATVTTTSTTGARTWRAKTATETVTKTMKGHCVLQVCKCVCASVWARRLCGNFRFSFFFVCGLFSIFYSACLSQHTKKQHHQTEKGSGVGAQGLFFAWVDIFVSVPVCVCVFLRVCVYRCNTFNRCLNQSLFSQRVLLRQRKQAKKTYIRRGSGNLWRF